MIFGMGKIILSYPKRPDRLRDRPRIILKAYNGRFLLGQSERDVKADHSVSSSAELENEWSCTSTPLYEDKLLLGLECTTLYLHFFFTDSQKIHFDTYSYATTRYIKFRSYVT